MDGLWIAQFRGSQQVGAGVVVFQGNQILGGDGGYFYTGTLEEANGTVTAILKVVPHSPGYASVFGTTGQTFNLELQGRKASDTTLEVAGFVREMPNMRFSAVLTKRAVS